jgi:hypothetical protein
MTTRPGILLSGAVPAAVLGDAAKTLCMPPAVNAIPAAPAAVVFKKFLRPGHIFLLIENPPFGKDKKQLISISTDSVIVCNKYNDKTFYLPVIY